MARPRGAWVVAVAIGFLAFAFGSATVRGQGSSLSPELEQLRLSLQTYQDPVVAIRDGYFSTLGCVEYPKPGGQGQVAYQAGAMGIHFLNPSLISPAPDPKRPTLLLYEPDAHGKLTLVGVEWFVPLAMGIKERPQLFGREFDGPMEGHEPLLPQNLHHYDLHVWLWKQNPAGLFSPTNPLVKCSGYSYTIVEEAPHIVTHPKQ